MRNFASSLVALNAGKRIFFFSTGLTPQYPLSLFYQMQPTSRFSSLWLLPAILQSENGDEKEPEAMEGKEELLRLIDEDFRRWTPSALAIDESPHKKGIRGDFDYIAWLSSDPTMAALLSAYHRVGQFADPGHHWQFGIYAHNP